MRTTLSIDDDVLAIAQARARRGRQSVGKVISDLAREALVKAPGTTPDTRNGFPLLTPQGTPVSDTDVERIRDEDHL